jgi:hypothetical protein
MSENQEPSSASSHSHTAWCVVEKIKLFEGTEAQCMKAAHKHQADTGHEAKIDGKND